MKENNEDSPKSKTESEDSGFKFTEGEVDKVKKYLRDEKGISKSTSFLIPELPWKKGERKDV